MFPDCFLGGWRALFGTYRHEDVVREGGTERGMPRSTVR
jgi:hypothetical protein